NRSTSISLLTICRITWIFFFSSRRRHTRFSRDWSSDVCSSDLQLMKPEAITPAVEYLLSEDAPTRTIMGAGAGSFAVIKILETRSEERRVGKECRSQRRAYQFTDDDDGHWYCRASAIRVNNRYA